MYLLYLDFVFVFYASFILSFSPIVPFNVFNLISWIFDRLSRYSHWCIIWCQICRSVTSIGRFRGSPYVDILSGHIWNPRHNGNFPCQSRALLKDVQTSPTDALFLKDQIGTKIAFYPKGVFCSFWIPFVCLHCIYNNWLWGLWISQLFLCPKSYSLTPFLL